jgi:hypothetical protein
MSHPAGDGSAAYPLRDGRLWNRSQLLWAAGLGLPALVLYLLSLAPAVGWWDSGELLACAKTLSVAHRPGFPLYLISGRVLFGWCADPRWLANGLSAILAAVALACLWRCFCLLSGDRPGLRLWAAAGGVLVAGSPLFARQAVRIEVYAPVYAVLACTLLLAAASQKAPNPRTAARRFLLSAYLLSLAFCLHSALTAPVAVAAGSLFLLGDFRPSLKQWAVACVCFVSGLTLYLYVPLRAPLAPYVWGQPDSWSGLLAYFSAADSHGTIASEAAGTLPRMVELWRVVMAETSPVLLWLGAAGVLAGCLRRPRSTTPLWLAGSGLVVAASVVSYVIPDNADLQAYLVPVLWALWWGQSQVDPARFLAGSQAAWFRVARVAIPVCVLASASLHAIGSIREVRHARLGLSDRWGTELLAEARPGDLVIVQDANTDFLLRGLLQTGVVPQVTVLDVALASGLWYRTWWESRQGLSGGDGDPQAWSRRIAAGWQARGGRVLVDYGTPGFLPSETTPLGMLCVWDTSGLQTPSGHSASSLRQEGAERDPEWVRSAVWFYYRLALHHRALGHVEEALRWCEEGLAWAPGEDALLQTRAELSRHGDLWGADLRASGLDAR